MPWEKVDEKNFVFRSVSNTANIDDLKAQLAKLEAESLIKTKPDLETLNYWNSEMGMKNQWEIQWLKTLIAELESVRASAKEIGQ